MYRVLIVDDEIYILDCLSELLESRPDIDVCCASSVPEAMGWLKRTKIDIIITDIQMPEMSGIDLAKKVNRNWPQCKIIFLTAYAEFNFAYEAIKNNVISYILKVESNEHILAEVDKAIELIDEDMNNIKLLERVKNQSTVSMPVIKKEILINLLSGNCENSSECVNFLKLNGTDISSEDLFIMFSGKTNCNLPETDIIRRYENFNTIQNIAEKYLNDYFTCNCVAYDMNKMVWILQRKRGTGSDTNKDFNIAGHEFVFIAGMLETVQCSCRNISGIQVSFVLHGKYLNLKQLSECFYSINNLIDMHIDESADYIIVDTAFSAPKTQDFSDEHLFKKMSSANAIERLIYYIENNDFPAYKEEFEEYSSKLRKYKNWQSTSAWGIYFTIANTILSYINKYDVASELSSVNSLNLLFHPQLAGSWSEVADYLWNMSKAVFDLRKTVTQGSSDNTVRFIKKYIKANITNDVSLTRLSEVSGYNANYLSTIFKANTGENINEYTSRKKMGRIRELMYDRDLNISEISEQAGFRYRTYFNRFVKKVTGLSPQEFRKQLFQEEDSIQI